MPNKPKHPCKHPGCNILISSGAYCPEHTQKRETRRIEGNRKTRISTTKRGYDYKWQQESKAYLASHPWCAECERQGRRTPATEVDHRIPHKGNRKLFWNQANWQSLCHKCHSIKTVREDGGFGNRHKPIVIFDELHPPPDPPPGSRNF